MGHEWDDVADGWDDAPGTREYAQGAFDSLIRRMADHDLTIDGSSVLDFGCGTGLLTELLVDRVASVDAVDPSPAMRRMLADKARERRWGSVRVLADLPADSTYDLIVCSSVLAFVDDHPGTVVRLAARLLPGGLLVQWDWAADEEDPDGGGLSGEQVVTALAAAGLVGVDVGVGFEARVGDEVMRPLMGVGRRP